MKLKAFLIMAGLWMGLFGLTACGGADVRTYQYPETSVLFDDFHIKKTVYSPGVMKLYYRGGQFKDTPIRCYDANFEDLGDQFEYSFQNGVLTVQADFAEQISGLTIEDKDHDTVYPYVSTISIAIRSASRAVDARSATMRRRFPSMPPLLRRDGSRVFSFETLQLLLTIRMPASLK